MRFLLKLFMPSADTLAKVAAEGIQKAVNNSGKEDVIAKYGTLADKAAETAKIFTDMAKDGRLDTAETEALQEMLKPVFAKVLEVI